MTIEPREVIHFSIAKTGGSQDLRWSYFFLVFAQVTSGLIDFGYLFLSSGDGKRLSLMTYNGRSLIPTRGESIRKLVKPPMY